MLSISGTEKVYLAVGSTDMRRSIDGLAAIVQQCFSLDPFSSNFFVFCNKNRTMIKILHWDHNATDYYEAATGQKPESGFYDLILSLDERRENTIYSHNIYVNSSGELVGHLIPYKNDKLYIAKRDGPFNINYTIILLES